MVLFAAHLRVDSGRDAVVHLAVELRQHVPCRAEQRRRFSRRPATFCSQPLPQEDAKSRRKLLVNFRHGRIRTVEDASLLKVADGSRLHDVAHDEALHRLVLRHESAGGLAEDTLDLHTIGQKDQRALDWMSRRGEPASATAKAHVSSGAGRLGAAIIPPLLGHPAQRVATLAGGPTESRRLPARRLFRITNALLGGVRPGRSPVRARASSCAQARCLLNPTPQKRALARYCKPQIQPNACTRQATHPKKSLLLRAKGRLLSGARSCCRNPGTKVVASTRSSCPQPAADRPRARRRGDGQQQSDDRPHAVLSLAGRLRRRIVFTAAARTLKIVRHEKRQLSAAGNR